MFRLLLTGLLLFSVTTALSQKALKNKVVTVKTDEEEVEIKAHVEDNILELTIQKNGDTLSYQIDLNDEKALAALEAELENWEGDVDTQTLSNCEHEDSRYTFLDRMKGKGGYLGVQIQELTDQLRDYFKIKGDGGVLIAEVVPDSPADEAHLKAGDVITRIDDTIISNPRELTQTIRSYAPETNIAIAYVRRGREQKTTAILAKQEHALVEGKAIKGHIPRMYFFDKGIPLPKYMDPDRGDCYSPQIPKALQKELKEIREELQKLQEEVETLKQP